MVQIPASKEALTRAMEELLKEQEQLCKNTKEQEQEQLCENTDDKLPRINFDRHIYVPLLLKKADIRISPPALNESERRFVEDLCNYWKGEKDKSLQGKEIFLLRNLSRGIGVGFLKNEASILTSSCGLSTSKGVISALFLLNHTACCMPKLMRLTRKHACTSDYQT